MIEITEEEQKARLKKEKTFTTVKKLAIFQVWIGLSVLCLCIGISVSINQSYWLNYSRIDFTVCVFIIFTGCLGIASGIYQHNAILNGTFMTFAMICFILSLGAVVKSALNLREVTSNWKFPISNGMILYLALFIIMIIETIYSVSMVIYCLHAANGCNKIVRSQATTNHSDPTYPMFTTPRGNMMVLPSPNSQMMVLSRSRNNLSTSEPRPAYPSTSRPQMLPQSYPSTSRPRMLPQSYPSTSRHNDSPPAYEDGDPENWTWM